MSGFSPSTCLPDETMIPPSNPVKFANHRSFPAELNEKKGRNQNSACSILIFHVMKKMRIRHISACLEVL
jgi:hypothetical protein